MGVRERNSEEGETGIAGHRDAVCNNDVSNEVIPALHSVPKHDTTRGRLKVNSPLYYGASRAHS